MSWQDWIPLVGSGTHVDEVAAGLNKVKGDADAIALLPYDDGTFWLKPAYYDKELLGGKGGYETEDGDVMVAEGDGIPKRELLGVPIVTAADPAEHVGAIEMMKAAMAQKKDIGEWLKVDKRGNVIEAGDALEPAPSSDVTPGVEGTMVAERADEMAAVKGGQSEQFYDAALAELEEQGDVTKIYDLAPPSAVVENGDGIEVEEATHFLVDQSKATDLMPTTINNTELQTELDKARMEEYDGDVRSKYLVYGLIIGCIITAVIGGAVAMLFLFMG